MLSLARVQVNQTCDLKSNNEWGWLSSVIFHVMPIELATKRVMMDEQNKTQWKVWAFVIGLNVVGLLGAIYLQSKGISRLQKKSQRWGN